MTDWRQVWIHRIGDHLAWIGPLSIPARPTTESQCRCHH